MNSGVVNASVDVNGNLLDNSFGNPLLRDLLIMWFSFNSSKWIYTAYLDFMMY